VPPMAPQAAESNRRMCKGAAPIDAMATSSRLGAPGSLTARPPGRRAIREGNAARDASSLRHRSHKISYVNQCLEILTSFTPGLDGGRHRFRI
jgi:hypothetical protein